MNEMNVQPVDLGDELRQGVQFCFALAPIVICPPIARQRLRRRELYSLGCICNRFSFRPPCSVYAAAQFGEFRLWKIHLRERTNSIRLLAASLRSTGLGHGILLLSSSGF